MSHFGTLIFPVLGQPSLAGSSMGPSSGHEGTELHLPALLPELGHGVARRPHAVRAERMGALIVDQTNSYTVYD
jgi:hypothetical protein